MWNEENAIDFVPSSWANENKTLYKYPQCTETKMRQLIYECKNITENFSWFKATLKKGNIQKLEIAKKLCEKGKFSSNIDTSSDSDIETGGEKEKRKKNRRDD